MRTKLEIATQALKDVADPLMAMRRHAESQGATLSGMAHSICNDPYHIKKIAKEALDDMEYAPAVLSYDDMRERVSDEDVRALLSATDVGSGRAKLQQIFNKLIESYKPVEPCFECGSTERMGTACAPCNPDITDPNFGMSDDAR